MDRRMIRMFFASLMATCLMAISSAVIASGKQFDGRWIKDPTKPYGAVHSSSSTHGKSAGKLILSATWLGPTRKKARINGILVGEGDYINAARVEKIESGKVVLRRDGRSIVIKQGRSRLKRRVAN